MIFKKKVTRNRLYKEYVTLFNGWHGLSERELDVFASIVRIDYEIRTKWLPDSRNNDSVISTVNRKRIMKETLINKNNLSRYVGNLKKTKAIVTEDSVNWRVNDNVMRPLLLNNENISLIFTFEVDG